MINATVAGTSRNREVVSVGAPSVIQEARRSRFNGSDDLATCARSSPFPSQQGEFGGLGTLLNMANHIHSAQPSDELDELVEELLACGAVLSQVVGGMIRLEAEGRSFPDAAPIPEVAHTLLREVLGDLRKSYSKRDVRVAASIVGKATQTICEEIFIVDPDWLDEIRAEGNE